MSKDPKFMNSLLHDMAREVYDRELRERELLLAKFIIDNPHITADRIGFVTTPVNGSLEMRVRELTDAEVEEGDSSLLS